ncbi:12295_t:CDS:2 [Entrophospora sp. SA101]|nr:8591_t:CDS:2 [Entrophospora sp. SA101]CAJ0764592.1 12295_t:CDS:2 [Entrophospora sp. SA101]CAJ0889215.1 5373_t:CDS:2 [Entrophospora sp. SA101]
MSPSSAQRVLLKSIASADPEGRFEIVDDIQTFYKIAIPQQEEQKQNLHVNSNNNVDSDKPVILCLHQIFGNLYTWRHLMQPLANATGCHVIAYDRVCFGFTERPIQWEEGKNPYTQEASCEFVLRFLSCLGYANKKIIFVGSSAGSAISCYLSIKYPHIAFALIFLGPPSIICKIIGSFLGKLILKFFLRTSFPAQSLYNDVKSIPDWETVVKPCYRVPLTLPNFYESVAFLMKYFIPLEILPHKNVLQKIPILFMIGDNDTYTKYDAHINVFEEIKLGSSSDSILEFKALTQCGHFPQDEKPQESTVMLLSHDSSDDELESSSSTQKSILLSSLKDNDNNSNNKKPDAYNYTLSWGNILKNLSYILIWYFFSTVLSFYNKSLMGKDNFNLKLPLFTSAIHTGMHSIITLVLMNDTLPFIYERKKGKSISIHSYVTRVIPCAVAAALEICMANASLVYITLSFYTMVKSSTPVWVLLFAFLFHLEQPRILLVLIITVISVGVILTVAGETKFNLIGFLLVLGAAIISGLRWTLTQILLQKEEGMNDPISTLYYISPVMFIMMLILSLMFENPLFIFSTSIHFRSFKTSLQTFGLMLTGGLLAFCMTVAEFALIKNTSTVTLSVAGISKEVLVIALSVIIYDDAITSINLLG